jgi:hypothetical protein
MSVKRVVTSSASLKRTRKRRTGQLSFVKGTSIFVSFSSRVSCGTPIRLYGMERWDLASSLSFSLRGGKVKGAALPGPQK